GGTRRRVAWRRAAPAGQDGYHRAEQPRRGPGGGWAVRSNQGSDHRLRRDRVRRLGRGHLRGVAPSGRSQRRRCRGAPDPGLLMPDVESAVAEAFRQEWGRVVATLIRMTGDWDMAEECAQ